MSKGIGRLITRLGHDEAITRLEPVVIAFTTGPPPIKGTWAGFMTTPEELHTVFYAFKNAHVLAKSTGSFSDIALRNSLRPGFNVTFTDFMDYVELASRKDQTLPFRAGMDYFRKPATTPKAATTRSQLTAPEKFTAKQGTEKGMVICSAAGVPGAKGFEIQFTAGDPMDESTWKHYMVYGGASKMIMNGLEPGTYTIRVRAIRSNEWGPWSHYITMLVF